MPSAFQKGIDIASNKKFAQDYKLAHTTSLKLENEKILMIPPPPFILTGDERGTESWNSDWCDPRNAACTFLVEPKNKEIKTTVNRKKHCSGILLVEWIFLFIYYI